MPPMALEGITVLDCTQVMAGPFCTMLLADMGADVIKIEKPTGDDSRRMGPPFINGESAAFLGINRNKKSIVLDFKRDLDRDVFRRMAQYADVVAENFKPGVMERLGLGADRPPRAPPGADLRLRLRFRPDRAVQPAPRVRPAGAGHVRYDERNGLP